MRAILAHEDGRYFVGESFGSPVSSVGEVCFNTSMTGYQEVLTDPSYRGQIVAMTSPQIGNYGVNFLDDESSAVHVRGFVIEELSPVASNWRSRGTLDEYLKKWKVPGIQGIDTRALTKHLRSRGAMQGCLTTENITPEEAVAHRDEHRHQAHLRGAGQLACSQHRRHQGQRQGHNSGGAHRPADSFHADAAGPQFRSPPPRFAHGSQVLPRSPTATRAASASSRPTMR